MPTQFKVLIADNDGDVSSVLAEVIRSRGLAVDQCSDGETALARVAAGGVDLLVCDLDMPRLPGEEVVDALRSRRPDLPVVVISGYLDDALRARLAAASNVVELFQKPFDVLVFADLVARLVRPVDRTSSTAEPAGGSES